MLGSKLGWTHAVCGMYPSLVELYTNGNIDREDYVEKSLNTDNEINKLKLERSELMKKIPLLHNKDLVDVAIKRFSSTVKAEYKKCGENRDKQREFLLKYVDKIVYHSESSQGCGSAGVCH